MKYLLTVLLVVVPAASFARLPVLKQFRKAYPEFQTKYASKHPDKSASCNICHSGKPKEGDPDPLLNKYGVDVQKKAKVGDNDYNFTLIEKFDSDEDKAVNIDELNAGYMPGESDDHP